MILNGLNNERTFQLNENTPSITSLVRKSSENLRLTKQDKNNNMERSSSLQVCFLSINSNLKTISLFQIQSPTYLNPIPSTTINKTEENTKPTQVSEPENIPQIPISIPAALITAKPPTNVEQQRAIITRVKENLREYFSIQKQILLGYDTSRFR
jgi:hypothetical protein